MYIYKSQTKIHTRIISRQCTVLYIVLHPTSKCSYDFTHVHIHVFSQMQAQGHCPSGSSEIYTSFSNCKSCNRTKSTQQGSIYVNGFLLIDKIDACSQTFGHIINHVRQVVNLHTSGSNLPHLPLGRLRFLEVTIYIVSLQLRKSSIHCN